MSRLLQANFDKELLWQYERKMIRNKRAIEMGVGQKYIRIFLINYIIQGNKQSAACDDVQFNKHQRVHHCIVSTLNHNYECSEANTHRALVSTLFRSTKSKCTSKCTPKCTAFMA